jgi:cold shock CspA family protein
MSEAIITFVSSKGFSFGEDSETHSAVYIHQNDVEHRRYLKINDRVSFDLIPSPKYPDRMQATNVKYLGHTIAAQYSDKSGVL